MLESIFKKVCRQHVICLSSLLSSINDFYPNGKYDQGNLHFQSQAVALERLLAGDLHGEKHS